jgi:hypothetical protein
VSAVQGAAPWEGSSGGGQAFSEGDSSNAAGVPAKGEV